MRPFLRRQALPRGSIWCWTTAHPSEFCLGLVGRSKENRLTMSVQQYLGEARLHIIRQPNLVKTNDLFKGLRRTYRYCMAVHRDAALCTWQRNPPGGWHLCRWTKTPEGSWSWEIFVVGSFERSFVQETGCIHGLQSPPIRGLSQSLRPWKEALLARDFPL